MNDIHHKDEPWFAWIAIIIMVLTVIVVINACIKGFKPKRNVVFTAHGDCYTYEIPDDDFRCEIINGPSLHLVNGVVVEYED